MNNSHSSKQRGGRLAFALSCLLHLAAGTVIFFMARKWAVEQWPSMGPKAVTMIDIQQVELHSAAATPSQPSPPPPVPAPVEEPLEEPQKQPEPRPEPVVSQPVKTSEAPVSAVAQTAQMAQRASAPEAQIEAAEPLAGQGRTGDIDWRTLAIAKIRAMVEREKYYPPAAQKAGYTGRFRVRIRLEPDGTVSGCEITERRGHPLLGKAVETALGKIQGQNIGMTLPERFELLLPIEFELSSR